MIAIDTDGVIGVDGDRGAAQYLTHGAGTIDIVGYGTAIDGDRGVAVHDTGIAVVSVTFAIMWICNSGRI